MQCVLRLSPASCVSLYPAARDLWLGSCYIGKVAVESLHVTVRGLAAVGSHQPITSKL